MQTYLEQEAIKKRKELDILKDYNKDNQYGPNHPDAISDGDAQGKGTNSGGHGFTLPDHTKSKKMIDYSNFDTVNGGGKYDIEGFNNHGGRRKSLTQRLYSAEKPYEYQNINTDANIDQYSTNVK